MKISDLLVSPSNQASNALEPPPSPYEAARQPSPPPASSAPHRQPCAKAKASNSSSKHGPAIGTASVVPDSQRRRPRRLSVTQKLDRRAYQNYESKVFNLTLDINALKQQVLYLMECRDLHLTRMFLDRQHLEVDVLQAVEKLVNGFSKKGPSLTANQRSRLFSSQHMVESQHGSGVHDLVLERGTHIFSHRSWTTVSARVLCFVEEEEGDAADAEELRRLCGGGNGCVVETVGVFTGRIKREMIAAFYPHALGDEALVARLIGYRITCPVRLVFYFDEQRCITHQVAQVDVIASMKPLQQASPADFAVLMGRK
ncbi:uncharacterized protein IUM83_10598 [Phytophthora cinnamomi]|uniref:uncharacterized protein n=1 Tax=Phytophthora cinnamomi TaxID=4785 RepID=UPI00355A6BD5|nr:hypothetical protein IUM83_10598 [Phytophthora cinnamomi]